MTSCYLPREEEDLVVEKLFNIWNKEFLKRQKELDENQE
jgi:hypothetical protein